VDYVYSLNSGCYKNKNFEKKKNLPNINFLNFKPRIRYLNNRKRYFSNIVLDGMRNKRKRIVHCPPIFSSYC
jgi:hypothetical protein